jgi:hypothetical protein
MKQKSQPLWSPPKGGTNIQIYTEMGTEKAKTFQVGSNAAEIIDLFNQLTEIIKKINEFELKITGPVLAVQEKDQ